MSDRRDDKADSQIQPDMPPRDGAMPPDDSEERPVERGTLGADGENRTDEQDGDR